MNKAKNKKNEKGFVILYAVMISSMLLAISLGVANISLKEINFGTSAIDTNNAFFAADTGAECALFNDKSTESVFVESSSPTITCNGNSITANESPALYWSFIISGLGNSGNACAVVTVDKTDPAITTIISKGYNVGGDTSCVSTDSNRVERQLELNY
ncbi:hypothetical protein A3B84_00400 [Candidatus Nomurabacteria bacterium RIFCSPHIGHO2_02_FULL_35_13]|uniref:Type 4 fimbrial biogenesis protein PilX N-terminal domain-containing protein n=2 Tax=Candidatus Nomuraibacteriota TaxID=1752729 RepID=A0A1F6VPR9_9BACT|nr:MAG: hypothetical protein UR88_C0009G0008 [Candidatus Nomurabacteria bacterium GW2011_GWA1_35_8]OGI71556.1 MAG: hypothetical protein A3B84_00400 [Candidatus Nomurabacteria bacterium RIFCSPHIGHO2_02_FULL_35_13]